MFSFCSALNKVNFAVWVSPVVQSSDSTTRFSSEKSEIRILMAETYACNFIITSLSVSYIYTLRSVAYQGRISAIIYPLGEAMYTPQSCNITYWSSKRKECSIPPSLGIPCICNQKSDPWPEYDSWFCCDGNRKIVPCLGWSYLSLPCTVCSDCVLSCSHLNLTCYMFWCVHALYFAVVLYLLYVSCMASTEEFWYA